MDAFIIIANKVLIVGVGELGFAILKRLIKNGYVKIQLIDCALVESKDVTDDYSYEQFHIGQSKSYILRDIVKHPRHVGVEAIHDSILSATFDVNFIQEYNLVINTVKSRTVKIHLNRICIAADVNYIDAATSAYSGNVEYIRKALTACYECRPRADPPGYPTHLIRNTPSEPIHCVIWAIHLYEHLFGKNTLRNEICPDIFHKEILSNLRTWAKLINYNSQKLFERLFNEDIQKLMLFEKKLWKIRKQPVPIHYTIIIDDDEENYTNLNENEVWSIMTCQQMFEYTVKTLKTKLDELPQNDYLRLDKRDRHFLFFVTACANLRSKSFGIVQKSLKSTKKYIEMIIRAITPVDITANLVVEKSSRIINHEQRQLLYPLVFENFQNLETQASKPNPKCHVCSPNRVLELHVNVYQMTLLEFEYDILKNELNIRSPDVRYNANILISSEAGETNTILYRTLSDMGVLDNSCVIVDDFSNSFELTLVIKHSVLQLDKDTFFISPAIRRCILNITDVFVESNASMSDDDDNDDDDDDDDSSDTYVKSEDSEQKIIPFLEFESDNDIIQATKRIKLEVLNSNVNITDDDKARNETNNAAAEDCGTIDDNCDINEITTNDDSIDEDNITENFMADDDTFYIVYDANDSNFDTDESDYLGDVDVVDDNDDDNCDDRRSLVFEDNNWSSYYGIDSSADDD